VQPVGNGFSLAHQPAAVRHIGGLVGVKIDAAQLLSPRRESDKDNESNNNKDALFQQAFLFLMGQYSYFLKVTKVQIFHLPTKLKIFRLPHNRKHTTLSHCKYMT
jgi:hypothetical protein